MHYYYQFDDYSDFEPHFYSWKAILVGLFLVSFIITAINSVIVIVSGCDLVDLPADWSTIAASSSFTWLKFQVEVVSVPLTNVLNPVDSYDFYREALVLVHSQLLRHLVKPSFVDLSITIIVHL